MLNHHIFIWPPPKRRVELIIVIPCSILAVEQSLYEKTIILGFLARALAIFRVSEVLIFVDDDCREEDLNIIIDVMNYMLTPPYMRKKVISRRETLRYAGVLPPLNIPTHPSSDEGPSILPIREGIIVGVRGRYAKVDVGLRDNVVAEVPDDVIWEVKLRVGSKVFVKIVEEEPLRGIVIAERDIPWYLGFKVKVIYDVNSIIKMLEEPGVLGVMTTKYGDDVSKLLSCGKDVRRIVIFFGNYRKDFNELVSKDVSNILSSIIKVSINTIPLQGVRTVRTVEAVYATLALINELMYHTEIND